MNTSVDSGGARVAVVGAGMAGLAAVRALARSPASVVLIDEHNYSAFPPLLFQVATCFISPADIARPVRAMLHRQRNATFRLGRVTGVDPIAHRLSLADGSYIDYDHLVLAPGVVAAFANIAGAARYAIPLKTVNDAIRLRNSLLRSFEVAAANPTASSAYTSVAVIGGGTTGVELAGYIADFLLRRQFPRDYPQLDPAAMRVTLIERGPRLLPAFHPRLSSYTHKTLVSRGVDVRVATDVVEVDVDGVTVTGGERIPAATVVWAGGVEAPDWIRELGLEMRHGRVVVNADLTIPRLSDVSVVGDLAAIPATADSLRPQVAQVAIQTGRHAGRQINRRLIRRPTVAFSYFDKGMMATVGRNAAIIQSGHLRLTGRLAWFAWGALHINYLPGELNRLATGLKYLWWHVAHENANRVLIEPEPEPEPEPGPAATAQEPARRRSVHP